MAAKTKYEVLTWDSELETWTPQQGVRRGPHTLWGLKRALRKLRAIGYPCNYRSKHYGMGDPFVSVSKIWTDEEIATLKRSMAAELAMA